jgi:hypothetical protein
MAKSSHDRPSFSHQCCANHFQAAANFTIAANPRTVKTEHRQQPAAAPTGFFPLQPNPPARRIPLGIGAEFSPEKLVGFLLLEGRGMPS